MVYNYFTGAATPVPTITFISPADATVSVGAYDNNGYFPLTISKDCQFTVNQTGYSPINVKVEATATVDLTGIARTTDLSSINSSLSTLTGSVATSTQVGVIATNVGTMDTNLTGAINAQNTALTGAINGINTDIVDAVNSANDSTVDAVNAMNGNTTSYLGQIASDLSGSIASETTNIKDDAATNRLNILGAITTAITKINTVDTVVDGIDTIVDGIANSLESISSNAASAATNTNGVMETLQDGIGGMYGYFDVVETDIANVAIGVWSYFDRTLTSDFSGVGDNTYTYTVYTDASEDTPLVGCLVWIKNSEGVQVAVKLTNTNGEVHFKLESGVYNIYRQHPEFIFVDPVEITIGE